MAYSTDWQIIRGPVGAQPIAEVSTTQRHALGTRVFAVDKGSNANGMGEFIYTVGVSNGATGSWVGIFQDGYTTVLATADGVYHLMGVMMSTLDATTDYGWCQISGKAVAKALSGYVDNAAVYLTGTAGSVDDTDVAGDYVNGALGASNLDVPATGFAEFEIHYPNTDNALDD